MDRLLANINVPGLLTAALKKCYEEEHPLPARSRCSFDYESDLRDWGRAQDAWCEEHYQEAKQALCRQLLTDTNFDEPGDWRSESLAKDIRTLVCGPLSTVTLPGLKGLAQDLCSHLLHTTPGECFHCKRQALLYDRHACRDCWIPF